MKCYKRVLKVNNLIKNYGFFIVCSVMILYFIVLFIFMISSFSNIKKEIYNIIFALKIKGNPIKKKKIKKFYDKTKIENNGNETTNPFNLNKKNKMKHKNFSLNITQNIIYNSYNKTNVKKDTIIDKNNI